MRPQAHAPSAAPVSSPAHQPPPVPPQLRLRARLAALHRAAGSLWGVLLFVILFSGTWAAAQSSLQDWWRQPAPTEPSTAASTTTPHERRSATQPHALPLDTLWQHALAHGLRLQPEGSLRWLLPDEDSAAPLTQFCNQQRCSLTLDARTGAPMPEHLPGEALATLHRSFFAGFPGRIAISLFGLWMLIVLACGLWLQAPAWRQTLRLRRQQGMRTWHADLHALLGLWTVPWLTLFALTGALSGLGALGTLALAPVVHPGQPRQIMQDLMGPPPPAALHRPWSAPPALDALLRADALAHPGFQATVLTLNHPGDAGASVEIGGVQRGVLSTPLFERRLYEAATGRLLRSHTAHDDGLWLQAFIAVQPLHTAQYSGLPAAGLWRALHWLTALGACVLAATGLHLWMLRRRSHHLSRIVLGVCAGLVLYAGATLVSGQASALLRHAPPAWLSTPGTLGLVWLACVLLAVALPRRWPAGVVALALCGLLALCATALHLCRLAALPGTPSAWWADLSLAGLGVLLLHHAWRLRQATPHTPAQRVSAIPLNPSAPGLASSVELR
jgi:uncharacterized iron-regulated membrane protein